MPSAEPAGSESAGHTAKLSTSWENQARPSGGAFSRNAPGTEQNSNRDYCFRTLSMCLAFSGAWDPQQALAQETPHGFEPMPPSLAGPQAFLILLASMAPCCLSGSLCLCISLFPETVTPVLINRRHLRNFCRTTHQSDNSIKYHIILIYHCFTYIL